MTDVESARQGRDRALLRIGGACAIAGAVVSVAAGTGGGALAYGASAGELLRALAERPDWSWPLVHMGFMAGALLWVWAFIALADSLSSGAGRALGRMATASAIIGAAVHLVDSLLNVALVSLADVWSSATGAAQADVLRATDLLLTLLDGSWAGVVSLFHGVPFVLAGLAVVCSRNYSVWLGLVGAMGGAGSLVLGVGMLPGLAVSPEGLYVPFAVLISVWMIALGSVLLSRAAGASDHTSASSSAAATVPDVPTDR